MTPPPLVGSPRAYVGSYTSPDRMGCGQGISVFEIGSGRKPWRMIQLLEMENPSYLVCDRSTRRLYVAHGDLTYLTTCKIDPESGRLSVLGHTETGGLNTVHMSLDNSGRFLVCANYSAGNLSVFALRPDGLPGERTEHLHLQGERGPHRLQQTQSLPHEASFDPSGRYLVVPDKGLDTVFVFRLTPQGRLVEADSVKSRPGAGPRHVSFHPAAPLAYVLNELDSTIVTYRLAVSDGKLTPLQVLTSLPDDFFGRSIASEIRIDPRGSHVFASNRGHDSIAVFRVSPAGDRLRPTYWRSTAGETPRFITFDPSARTLYAANQASNSIVAFKVAATGGIGPARQIVETGSPACLLFC